MGRINELTIKPVLTEGDIIPIWDSRAGRTRAVLTDSLKDFIKIEAHTDTHVVSGTFAGDTLTLTMNDKTIVSIPGFDFQSLETKIASVKGDITKNATEIKLLDDGKADHLLLKATTNPKTIEYELKSGDTTLVDQTLDLSDWFTENPVVGMHFVGIFQTLGALETAYKTPAANMQAIVIDPSEKYYHAVGSAWVELAPVATFHNGYVGVFDSLVLLRQAVPNPNANDMAIVGTTSKSFYYYDNSAAKWTLVSTVDLTSLSNRVGQNESNISTLQADNTKNKQDIATALSGVNGNDIELAKHDNEIGVLQGFQTTTEPKITNLETVTNSNVNRIQALESDPKYNQLEPRVTKNESDIKTIDTQLTGLGNDITQLQGQVYTGNKVIGEDGKTLNDITGLKFDNAIVSDDDGDKTATITVAPKFTIADGQGLSSKSYLTNAIIFPDATLVQDSNNKNVITVDLPDEFKGSKISDDKQHTFSSITDVQFEHCTVRSDTTGSVVVTVDQSAIVAGSVIRDDQGHQEDNVTDITLNGALLTSTGKGKATITISPDSVYPGANVKDDKIGDFSKINNFNFVNATVSQTSAGSATITLPTNTVRDSTGDTYGGITSFKFVNAKVSQAIIGEAVVTITPESHYTGNVVKNKDGSVDLSDVTDFIFVGCDVKDLGSNQAQITPVVEFGVSNESNVVTVAKSLQFPGATITADAQDANKIIVDMPDVYGGNDVADTTGADFQGITKFNFSGATVTTADAGKTAVVTIDHIPADITVTDGKQTTFTGTQFVFPDRKLSKDGDKITIGETDTPKFDDTMFQSAVDHGAAPDNADILSPNLSPGWWSVSAKPSVQNRPADALGPLTVFKQDVTSSKGQKHTIIMCFGFNMKAQTKIWVRYGNSTTQQWGPYLTLGADQQAKVDALVTSTDELKANDAATKAELAKLTTQIGDVYAPDQNTFDNKVNELIAEALKHHVPEGVYPNFYASYGPKNVNDLTGLAEIKTGRVKLTAINTGPYYLTIFVLDDLEQADRVKGWKMNTGQIIYMNSFTTNINGKKYRIYKFPVGLYERTIELQMSI